MEIKAIKPIEEILNERERCKQIVIRKIDAVIIFRKEKIKHRKRRNLSSYERLKDNIIFLIDNPNYVRKPKQSLSTS